MVEANLSVGDTVEKFEGEALWEGVIVSVYWTLKEKKRYVVEVLPQGFQMIAHPNQLRWKFIEGYSGGS